MDKEEQSEPYEDTHYEIISTVSVSQVITFPLLSCLTYLKVQFNQLQINDTHDFLSGNFSTVWTNDMFRMQSHDINLPITVSY